MIFRQGDVIQVREDGEIDKAQRLIVTGWRFPSDEVLADSGSHDHAARAEGHVNTGEGRDEVSESRFLHPVAQVERIATVDEEDIRLLNRWNPEVFIYAGEGG